MIKIYKNDDSTEEDITQEVIAYLTSWADGAAVPSPEQGICGNLWQVAETGGCRQICQVFKALGYRDNVYPLGRDDEYSKNKWEGELGIRRRNLCLEAANYLNFNNRFPP